MSQPDPSLSVPQDLMPHVHLVSSFRYPSMAHVNVNEVAKWLLNAPMIARDKAPFFWTYLDKPADGTILMTWQPLQRLGTNFATDGFVWAPQEQLYKHDLGNGLALEVYYLKAGYIPGEQFAAHARRRFRLVPAPGHPNPPQPDTNLFIIHYGPAEPNEAVPANVVPYDQRVHAQMQQRQFLQRAGQIRRKEFMLSDRANWPSLPELTRQQMEPQMVPRGVPQQMAYPPQTTPGPPAKRARHAQPPPQQPAVPGVPLPDPAYDDDEDTSRGDMFDHMTPREISLGRYQQNHEWMEEVLSSPYRMNQITPSDLGLGLKGDLAALTEGIFSAPGGEAFQQIPQQPYVGRLDPGKADEFRKRVETHVESEKKEMEEMEKAYNAILADMKRTTALGSKEKDLRVAGDPGVDLWQPSDSEAQGDARKKTVDQVVLEIESATGKTIEAKPTVKCVQVGGWQAPAPEPEPEPEPTPEPEQVAAAQPTEMSRQGSNSGSQNSGVIIGESDIEMGGTAAGLLDQMHTGFSANSTPVNNFPTPQPHQSAMQSDAATPSNANVPSPAVAQPQAQQQQLQPQIPQQQQQQQPQVGGDVSMGGADGEAKDLSGTAPDQGTGSGDWVVVPKEDGMAGSSAAPETSAAGGSDTPKPTAAAPAKPVSAAATPAITDGGFDHNDFSSLGDLDTAGDALAGFDAPALDGSAGELGDDLDLQMDMEDSAFGDAFHGVDPSGTPGQDM